VFGDVRLGGYGWKLRMREETKCFNGGSVVAGRSGKVSCADVGGGRWNS